MKWSNTKKQLLCYLLSSLPLYLIIQVANDCITCADSPHFGCIPTSVERQVAPVVPPLCTLVLLAALCH